MCEGLGVGVEGDDRLRPLTVYLREQGEEQYNTHYVQMCNSE
jgi:hypothetical protein